MSLFFDLMIEDVVHYMLNMLDGADRIRLATVSRRMAALSRRYIRPALDPWFYVIPYTMLDHAPDFSKQTEWVISDLNTNLTTCISHARLVDRANLPVIFSVGNVVVDEWVTFTSTHPEAIKRTVLTKDTVRMEIDLGCIPTDTYSFPNIANGLTEACTLHERSSEVARFFREYPTDPYDIMECTPDAAILQNDAPPLVLPRTLSLRPHQLSAIDYLVRMEQRAARSLPMGSFAKWLPVKHANHTVWIDMLNPMENVHVRNPPATRIEYTSNLLCLADASGLGKTVTMLALMLGTGLVMSLYQSGLLIMHTRASLVLVDPLMLKGISDWRSLPGEMYPTSRVYVVEQPSDWKGLSRAMIREADLVIMSYSFYKDHYRMCTEYPNPEETSILSFQWQRVVLDDHHVHDQRFDHLRACVYYIIRPCVRHEVITHALTKTRIQGQSTWRPAYERGSHLVHYVLGQCTWRRTVRSVSNELARPSIQQTRVPIPMTEHENVIIDGLAAQGHVDHYDVPVNYKGTWQGTWRLGPRKKCARVVHVDPSVSVMGAYMSFNSTMSWKAQVGQGMNTPLRGRKGGLMQQQHGTLVTALLLLLRKHWQEYPKEPVLVVCSSVHAVARLGCIFKTQHVPMRTLSKIKIEYTAHERQELKALGRAQCMVYLIEQAEFKVGVNRFGHLRHIFAFGAPLTDTVMNSICRPVAPEDMGAPIQVTTVFPGASLLLDSTYDQTQQPYCDLNTNSIVIVS